MASSMNLQRSFTMEFELPEVTPSAIRAAFEDVDALVRGDLIDLAGTVADVVLNDNILIVEVR